MTLLYLHTYRLRDVLELTELEKFGTRYQIFRLLTLVAIFPIFRTSRAIHRRHRAAFFVTERQ